MAKSTARRKASTSSGQLESRSRGGLVLYLLEFPDGKGYVGLTKNLRQRISLHDANVEAYQRAGRALSRVQQAIKEFNHEFKVKVLATFTDKQEAQAQEEFEIKARRTFNKSFGYNQALGGGRLGLPHSDEPRHKQSLAATARYR